ncbi:carbohydrate-binding protein [Apiospora hydei]|uniref:Carbohydrate-binding protein n=1 Tax=Apiospora hydei TaxID=1337664 RepID=A0ABR1XA98_9PEZI
MVQYEKTQDMMKVFYIGHDSTGSAVHYFRYTTTSNWAGPIRIYGPDLHEWAPAMIAWAGSDSRLDVFAVSRVNNHLMHTFKEAETDKWSEYEDLKGFVTVPPTVVSWAPGRLDVFVRGGDAGLWHLSFGDGKWSPWQRISGTTRIQGKGESLYKTYDGVAQKWLPDDDGFTTLIPGGLVGPPSPMADGSEVQVFAYNSQTQIMWQTIGPDKKAKGDAKAWADVPYNVA